MAHFRYETTGTWLKGNTHIHSTASDGGKTFGELAEMYAAAGYDFLFRTDHWVASNAAGEEAEYPLLWLDGVELDGTDSAGSAYHVVALGTFEGLERAMGIEAAMAAVREQGGMLILAHPHWMGNSFEEALRYPFDGVEVYNHVCRWLNGKGDGGPYWSAMLAHRPAVLGFASDDAHIKPGHPGWNGGWVMVHAPRRDRQSILDALRAGHFYASTGPSFESIECDGDTVAFRCSPVQVARLVGPGWRGERTGSLDGALLTEGAFRLSPDWPYAYLQIEDAQGRQAWTNPLMVED